MEEERWWRWSRGQGSLIETNVSTFLLPLLLCGCFVSVLFTGLFLVAASVIDAEHLSSSSRAVRTQCFHAPPTPPSPPLHPFIGHIRLWNYFFSETHRDRTKKCQSVSFSFFYQFLSVSKRFSRKATIERDVPVHCPASQWLDSSGSTGFQRHFPR